MSLGPRSSVTRVRDEHALVLEVVLPVQRRVGDLARTASPALPWTSDKQLDARHQRLADEGLDGQPAEPERVRRRRQRERAGEEAVLEDGFHAHTAPFGNAVWLKLT